MRKIFSRENWEFYFEHPAVRWNVCYIVLLTIIGLILGFMVIVTAASRYPAILSTLSLYSS